MAKQEPITIKQNTFVGGVQDFLPSHLIRPTSALRLENCEIHVHGTVRRRGGMRSHYVHQTDAGSDTMEPWILKMFSGIRGIGPIQVAVWNINGAARITVDRGDTSQQEFDFLPTFSFDETGDVFKLLDRVYFGKAGQVPLYWEDGASALQQELAVPGFPGTTIPPVVTGVFFQGRGWAGGDPSAEDLVYFSNALGTGGNGEASRSPLTWNRDFQAFRMDGRVRAIVPFRNTALVVFTDTTIEMLEPNCCEILNTYRLVLHRTTGCPFRQTIQICGEDIFFMDQEGHIRSLKQTELDESKGVTNAPLSLTIKNVIDRQTKARLEKARSAFSKGMYWIAMPMDGSQVANEMWGWSIRDQAWVGPYFFGKDEADDVLTSMTIGGACSCRFDGDDERIYVLAQNSENAIKSYIALEKEDYDDDGVLIPVVIETRSYAGDVQGQEVDHLRKTWVHTEVEMRYLFDDADTQVAVNVEVRGDEGAYIETDHFTFVTDAGPNLPVDLPFALTPDSRQTRKLSLTGIPGEPTHLIQERVTIRDDATRWEILSTLVTGLINPQEFADH